MKREDLLGKQVRWQIKDRVYEGLVDGLAIEDPLCVVIKDRKLQYYEVAISELHVVEDN